MITIRITITNTDNGIDTNLGFDNNFIYVNLGKLYYDRSPREI